MIKLSLIFLKIFNISYRGIIIKTSYWKVFYKMTTTQLGLSLIEPLLAIKLDPNKPGINEYQKRSKFS